MRLVTRCFMLQLFLILVACTQYEPDSTPVATVEAATPIATIAIQSPLPDPTSTVAPLLCDTVRDENTAAYAEEVIELANLERDKVKVDRLTGQGQLMQAAQTHALDMACNLFMSHTGSDGSSPFERIAHFGYVFSAAAENVAAGYASPAEVVNGWMNSVGHRENLLNPAYLDVGIGYVFSSDVGVNGNYAHYWVMTLGRP